MKIKTQLIIAFILASLFACTSTAVDPTLIKNEGANLVIDQNLYKKMNSDRINGVTESDPIYIDSVYRIEDSLIVTVTYSGGCQKHSFDIIWNGLVLESYPMQIHLLLAHDDNGDECDGIITKTISIDLKLLLGEDYLDTTSYIISIFSLTNPTSYPDGAFVSDGG